MKKQLQVHKLINYHLVYKDNEISIQYFEDNENGFVFFSFETQSNVMYLQAADNEEKNIITLFERIDLDSKALDDVYDYLNGAFQLYVWNKNKKTLECVCDYLGLGSSVYVKKSISEVVFFANYLHFSELNIPLNISIEGLKSHFGFGYHVEPFEYIYI